MTSFWVAVVMGLCALLFSITSANIALGTILGLVFGWGFGVLLVVGLDLQPVGAVVAAALAITALVGLVCIS